MTTLYAVHGIESHAGWFAPLATELSPHGFELRTIDRTPRDRADGPDAWTDALSVADDAYLFAHSWGAKLATFAILERRVSPRALVLVAPGLVSRPDIARPEAWTSDVMTSRLRIPIDDDRFSSDESVLRFLATDPSRLRYVHPSFLAADRRIARALERGGPVDVPALIITAEEDAIVDQDATNAALTRLFPESTITTSRAHGHLVVLEAPSALARAIAPWLRSH